jgi:hypothetical protein
MSPAASEYHSLISQSGGQDLHHRRCPRRAPPCDAEAIAFKQAKDRAPTLGWRDRFPQDPKRAKKRCICTVHTSLRASIHPTILFDKTTSLL